MHKVMKSLVVAALLLFAGIGAPVAAENASMQSVRALMQKSGMLKQLEQIQPLMQAAIENARSQNPGMSEQEFSTLQASASAFAVSRLVPVVQRRLSRGLGRNDMRKVLAWFDSPTGSKVTQLEVAATSSQTDAERQQLLSGLTQNAARVEKHQRLGQAVGAADNGADMMIGMQVALLIAFNAQRPVQERVPVKAIRSHLEKQRPQLKQFLEQQLLMGSLLTYRELSDAELGKYLDFAESDTGRKYHKAASAALSQALAQAAQEMGRKVAGISR